jgi:hypothetical protein
VAHYLSEEVAIEIGVTTANGASGTSDITGVTVDMAGFDGIMAVVAMGPITSGAVTSIKWQQGADSAMGDAADLLASGQPIYDTDDNKVFYTDLIKPQERYVRVYVDRATQAATVGSVVYLKYRARRRPVTHGSNVSGEQLNGIAEGNAVISSTSPSASLSPSASASPSSSASPSA